MEVLRTNNLTKKYGLRTVVDSVNMTIEKGDIYGFIGKNGAGKTTLMRMILTLCKPSGGDYTLFGSKDIISGCKKIGSLIETPCLTSNITAYETLRRYSILYGADVKEIDNILDIVGLNNVGKKKVGQFSLGMRQRMGIAIALIGYPEFMILDEPVNGLDPVGMKEIRDTIIKLNKEKGITFLISSHLLDEIAKTANKIGIINEGHLLEEVTMEELGTRCKKKLVIDVDNTERAEELLKEEYQENDFYEDNGKLIFEDMSIDSGNINSFLVKNGIVVRELSKVGKSLEQYYIEKVGGVNV